MKTSAKIISATLIAGLIITGIIISQTGWAYGRWGQRNTQADQRGHTPGHEGTERANKANGSRKTSDPGSEISGIPSSPLSESEKAELIFQYQEEKLAHDLYAGFATKYRETVFTNITDSEQKHMDAVKALLDRYGIPVPVNYGGLRTTFDALKASGEKSLQSALENGLSVEMLDIEDIAKAIKTSDNDDLKLIFTNIGGASYNHLRGFSKALRESRLTTAVDISKYLSQADIETRGSLQSKFAERLKSEGITLPEGAGQGHEGARTGSGGHGGGHKRVSR